jgi:hypothetical protein
MPSSDEEIMLVVEKTMTRSVPEVGPPHVDAPQSKTPAQRLLRNQRRTLVIVAVLLLWTYLFNVFIREQGTIVSFFQILNTISDEFVMGSLLTIGCGLFILILFSITKLYGQIVANIYAFKILEDLWYNEIRQGRFRDYFSKLLQFKDQPLPNQICPSHTSSILFSLTLIYVMSWIYVILFSEALFFMSWSAGVDLEITAHNVLFMPTLAMAIPFCARVMAYLRYPYAQDYADFMPAGVFVLLVVGALGFLFESQTHEFYLRRIFSQPDQWATFLRNGVFLAFIPVFFEAVCWLIELHRSTSRQEQSSEGYADVPAELDHKAP